MSYYGRHSTAAPPDPDSLQVWCWLWLRGDGDRTPRHARPEPLALPVGRTSLQYLVPLGHDLPCLIPGL